MVGKWCGLSTVTREEGITHQNEAWIPPSQSAAQDSAVTLRLCFHMCSWGSKKRIANSNTASHRLCFSHLMQQQFIVWLSSSKFWTTPGLSPQEHQMGNDLETVSASSHSRCSNWLTYESMIPRDYSRNHAFAKPHLPNSSIWDRIYELMGKSPNSWGKDNLLESTGRFITFLFGSADVYAAAWQISQ